MRVVAVAVLTAALSAASAAFASPERVSAYWGWRYGPISGTATMTLIAPPLACLGGDRSEKRVVRGTYRISFTGTSMRRTRAAADIGYNLAAGGPAGNTEPMAIRARRKFEERIHVKTVTEDEEGNLTCTLQERSCSRTDTKVLRRASNRLNVWMQRSGRVSIYPPHSVGFDICAADVERGDLLIGDVPRRVFRLGLFNRPRVTLVFASTRRVGGQTPTGARVTGTLAYRSSIGIRRMPGTPVASCKVC
jgi:hypothetical protein